MTMTFKRMSGKAKVQGKLTTSECDYIIEILKNRIERFKENKIFASNIQGDRDSIIDEINLCERIKTKMHALK